MSDETPVALPASPDRRALVRLVRRLQRLIGERLGRDLFSIPAWDMLLDLYGREDRRPISLTGLSGASDVPSRTGLRTIDRLVRRGLLIRSRDETDGRRINVELTVAAIVLLDRLFDDLARLVDLL